ncbi:Putative DnaK suppressor protein DskA [Helicobacter mustelae 12198]|uniref:Putative DnaK suppressor protein DskA n=1 Tax=Helicobacter mustelae (strain ATCC 43772 / CCUG 25715 / CIP 103759 / LMG 18044 / NCTC 12198 / R85-136P) TaxID=679897 RepID=D3UFX7_HELM1|nr:Putative DnaK suppressor protein DskA [Helicobacter mustelae 12198]
MNEIFNSLDLDRKAGKFDVANINDEMDFISADLQHKLNAIIMQKHGQEIEKITKALKKITDNVYGVCEMCEEEIDIERLRVKPHAEFCIKCRQIYEKDQRNRKIG